MENLSIRIQKILLDKQMSKKTLAEKCGWTSSRLGNKFTRNAWSFDDLQLVANVLNTPIVISFIPQQNIEDNND